MTTNQASDQNDDGPGAGGDATGRDEVTRLFAAALDGDRRAEAALNLLGGFDDTAHRASVVLATAGYEVAATPPDVLASIDRTLTALRRHRHPS